MKTRWSRAALALAVVVALGATFAAYLSPHMAVDIASRVWACF